MERPSSTRRSIPAECAATGPCDRPIIIDRQIVVPPGTSRLAVDFEPLIEEESDELRRAAVELPSYRLETTVDFEADRIVLITLDETRGELVVFDEGSPGS
jgi:hypothetical protein